MRASAADLPVEVSKAITVQGARLAEAIMLGIKNIENRLFSMKPGWYALHVGRQLEHRDPSINIILDSCPEVAPALKLPVSAVVGIIHIEQHVSCRSVPNEKWAIQQPGMLCNIISCVSRLPTPIYDVRGQLSIWPLDRVVANTIGSQLSKMKVVKSCALLPMNPIRACASSASSSTKSPAPQQSVVAATFTCKCCLMTTNKYYKLMQHLKSHPICAANHHTRLELQSRQASRTRAESHTPSEQCASAEIFTHDMRSLVSDGLASLQLDSLCDNTLRDQMKGLVKGWLSFAGKEIERRLQPMAATRSDKDYLHSVVTQCLDVFDGLNTARQEEGYLRRTLPYVQPVERVLGTHTDWVTDAEGFKQRGKTVKDHCYDLPLASLLARLFQQDSRAWEQVQQSQVDWRELPSASSETMVISDVVHGTLFRSHTHSHVPPMCATVSVRLFV